MTRPRPAAGGGRRLGVAPERLGRWLDGVAERHGAFTEVALDDGVVRVTCADSTTVALRAPFDWTPGPALLTSFTTRRARAAPGGRAARAPRPLGGRRVRRRRPRRLQGGRPAGPGADGGRRVVAAAVRPPPGHQTDAVVEHAVETAVRVLLPHAGAVVALFTGGDRGLVDEVLADPRLRALAALRREPHLDVGDPTKAVLLETPEAVPRRRRPHHRARRAELRAGSCRVGPGGSRAGATQRLIASGDGT